MRLRPVIQPFRQSNFFVNLGGVIQKIKKIKKPQKNMKKKNGNL